MDPVLNSPENTVERIETTELPAENNYLISVHDLEADGSVGQTALSATVNVVSTITTASQGTMQVNEVIVCYSNQSCQ